MNKQMVSNYNFFTHVLCLEYYSRLRGINVIKHHNFEFKNGRKKTLKNVRIWSFLNVEGNNLLINIHRHKLVFILNLYLLYKVVYCLLFIFIKHWQLCCKLENQGDNFLTYEYFLINICPEVYLHTLNVTW